MSILIRFFLLALFITSSYCLGEYRAYEYLVEENQKSRTMIVSHNPVSFKSYLQKPGQNVTLLRTWICPGHTGRLQQICSSPYGDVQ